VHDQRREPQHAALDVGEGFEIGMHEGGVWECGSVWVVIGHDE
jgi:hypothetical protein